MTDAPPYRLGYNTNGLPFHRLPEALQLVHACGYDAVAITPDVGALDPFRPRPGELDEVHAVLAETGLAVAIETGARFLLDPERKHQPTLLDDAAAERERRIDFYRRAIDLATDLGADVVSLWSGAAPAGAARERLVERLGEGLAQVLEHARPRDIRVAFEPEPGMFIERPAGYRALIDWMGADGDDLGLTLDVGHCVVTGDLPVSDVIAAWRERLVHVHLADCPSGVHQHVPFGEGDLDLADTLAGLAASGFAGIAAVELSRDGHRGPDAARDAYRALRPPLVSG